MSDLISIIIPVYNAGKTIDGCVESVLKSTYSDFEILIIDDGSNVETAEECDKVALKDHRIKVIHQENGGVSKARNCGIENAKGKFITFVDADDTVDSDLLASMMNAMRQEQADVVITGHRECYDDGSFKECFCSEKESIKCGTEILSEFFTTNNISWTVWAKLYTRSIIGDVRFQVGKRIAEDMYFNYEILKKAKTVVECGSPKYNYIKQDESAMVSSDCSRFFDSFYLTKAVFDDIETNENHRTDKVFFYVRSGLFFFRMMYAKDRNKEAAEDIRNARRAFLDSIHDNTTTLPRRMRLELFLLKYCEPLYRQQAKIYWGGIQEENVKYESTIDSYAQLRKLLNREKKNYPNNWFDNISCNQRVYNWRFIKLLRKCEYYRSKTRKSNNPLWMVLYWIARTHKNHMGVFIGVEIPENVFGEGLIIHHNGSIVVNGSSKVGKNCQLHGDNCIGNVGKSDSLTDCPQIGNNVEIGVGAKVLGGIIIADNIKIGANAVVTKSFDEKGITLVGIPAHKLER